MLSYRDYIEIVVYPNQKSNIYEVTSFLSTCVAALMDIQNYI